MTMKYRGKKCCVLGFGRSNKPLVDMLLAAGAEVTVHDGNATLCDERLEALGVKFCVGEGYLETLSGDYIFRSPGIRHDLGAIEAAKEKGACLTSEMELFFELCPATLIGITGSDGKTTTTTLTHLFLKKELEKRGDGAAYVGGNIGQPLLPIADKMTERDFAVVELSSFQLQTMKQSPKRALITNISPNHLNWHTDYEEYAEAKYNICRNDGIEMLATNAEYKKTREIADEMTIPVTYFSSKRHSYTQIVPENKNNAIAIYEDEGMIYVDNGKCREAILKVSDILLPGVHNMENYMAAIGLTYGLVSKQTVAEVARTFGGVEHRLELVREKDGVRYYNSSIDSSPSRTMAALGALDKKPIIICGGAEKGIEFDELADALCQKTKSVVLTGATAQIIYDKIMGSSHYDPERLPVCIVSDFREAVLYASGLAEAGDVVLLSPACTSFDRFRDFEHRGNYFKSIVREL
ncbi:MAG: UDP-N-acetylmuramoyl-L-alanine--D-glutamate ligase [Clostridia bacterium]|nr:UDP-N-acetylmuramoyl-L-alanine--D-glutamate ligase [Clostridia bacterium]